VGRFRPFLVLLAACAALSGPGARAQTPEAQVKAAYLHKLASFVRWPASDRRAGDFRFCVAGRSDVAAVLRDLVRGERVAGRPLEVVTLTADQQDRARTCHVLFLGRGPETARALISAAAREPVLTVGDRNGGTRGGVIDFVLRDGKVRFLIDRELARRQELELSSKLLDVALAVER